MKRADFHRPARRLDFLGLIGVLLFVSWIWCFRIMDKSATALSFGSSDLFLYYVPTYSSIREAFLDGRFPLWNPRQGTGVPQVGPLQGGVFYPARWLLLFFSPSRALGLSTFLHLGLAATGMFALCRALEFGRSASATAAVIFGWGFGVPSIYQPIFLEPGAWWPVAALAVLKVAESHRWAWVVTAALATAAPILAGGSEIVVYGLYSLGLFFCGFCMETRTRTIATDKKTFLCLATAAALSVMVSSIQWSPTLEWSKEAIRTTRPLTATQVDPLGPPPVDVAASFVSRSPVGTVFRIGPPVLVLTALGALFGRRLVSPLVVGSAVAFLLSLGSRTPWFNAYFFIPGVSMFRGPKRLQYVVVIGTALASAAGIDWLLNRRRAWGKPTALIAGAAVALGLFVTASAIPGHQLLPVPSPSSRPDGVDFISTATMVAVGFLPSPLIGPAAFASVVVSTLALELDKSAVPYSGDRDHFRRRSATYRRIGRAAGLWRSTFVPPMDFLPSQMSKSANLEDLYFVGDYESMSSRHLVRYFSLLVEGRPLPDDLDALPAGELALRARPAYPHLLDMLSVRYLIANEAGVRSLSGSGLGRWLAEFPEAPDLVSPKDAGDLRVYVNDSALPRAYTVEGLVTVPDDDAAEAAIVSDGFDARRQVVVTADVSPRPQAGPLEAARIVSYRGERVVVRTGANRDAILVLTDAFAPGWTVKVDDSPAPLWRANGLFRAVPVPAGEHEVVFEYSAPGLHPAVAAASLAGVCSLALPLMTVLLRRSRAVPSGRARA